MPSSRMVVGELHLYPIIDRRSRAVRLELTLSLQPIIRHRHLRQQRGDVHAYL